jgi:RNA recognition motif-containing protein
MKGFAHVDFETAESVTTAISKNGVEFEGRPLKVDASTPKPGGAGGRGGFGGGRGGRGGGDPMARAQKSGAMIYNGGVNVTTFD